MTKIDVQLSISNNIYTIYCIIDPPHRGRISSEHVFIHIALIIFHSQRQTSCCKIWLGSVHTELGENNSDTEYLDTGKDDKYNVSVNYFFSNIESRKK